MHPYLVYKGMADRVESGWTQGSQLRSVAGQPAYCVVGALNSTLYGAAWATQGRHDTEWWERVGEINQTVGRRFSMVFGRFVGLDYLTRWNDAPWRSKATVVRTLRRLQAKYADDYITTLEAKVAKLEAAQAELRQRLAASKAEVRHLRFRSIATVRADLDELAKLDAELNMVWGDLHAVRTS